jgi:nitrate reductase / nitrite oxidoreductase, alpha subunit
LSTDEPGNDTINPTTTPPVLGSLLGGRRYFRSVEVSSDGHRRDSTGRREWEAFYRDRWQHDRVVRSTHGVNCTGSCSWKVYVKDGIITWETQQVDYPSNGPDMPEYEPRGCPRGASFSWYTYSPLRVKYPYVRAELLEMFREAIAGGRDPVEAWASIVDDPEKARRYKSVRGKGGFVRASWDEVGDLIAAAHVHTVKRWGPDRVVGFTPIPAMSMVSYGSGTRFLSLIGGTILSFYDWYADLPPASPQVWGDQTDVPESADWWNAGYLIVWGTNLPITRTPDAHFMTEARYRGQKVVVVSPDYSDHTKFADYWLPAIPGTDGALAMAMGHVILKEFYVDRQVPYFEDYARRFTDLPFLVTLEEHDGALVPDRFLRASDLPDHPRDDAQADWKCVLIDENTDRPVVPNGSVGFRWDGSPQRRWNLDLGDVRPALTAMGRHEQLADVLLARFDVAESAQGGAGAHKHRGVPVRRVGDKLVTTVFDLVLAQYGVHRPGLPGEWPTGYDDPTQPSTPAWQEALTGVDAGRCARVAREFARNAELTRGRSMIAMGAGTNHWFHSDQIYRAMLSMLLLCGCQGVNGGGWAHYVGQEKVRPLTGWSTLAFALDWVRPPRQMVGTPFWYLASDQWRYERFPAGDFLTPTARGSLRTRHIADCFTLASRLGWMPSFPSFDRNTLDICDEADRAGVPVQEHVVRSLRDGTLRFACEDPDAPENFPRVLTLWRANLLGSSNKGHEYVLKHLLGVDTAAVRNVETEPEHRPHEVAWRDDAPEGKLDLLTTIDFRHTGSCLYSDVVLPAATWYEKHDLSTTDLHPFVNSFNPAITPPWETRTDFDIFQLVAERFSQLAVKHLGVRRDVVPAPLAHDSADELAQPMGSVRDWRAGECDPVPGVTMPRLVVVDRDYTAIHARMNALGPLVEEVGVGAKGIRWKPVPEVEDLRRRNGTVRGGVADGRPSLRRDVDWCETILALSGTTNGRISVDAFRELEGQTGRPLVHLAEEHAAERITFADTQVQPRKVITSPEWSGIESRDRRYSPFTLNVENLVPWHTLTGRQHFYLDHEWMLDYGESMPIYRPPLTTTHRGEYPMEKSEALEMTMQYITPHSKWSIHSEYQDNIHMLTLFRGGPVIWMNNDDAAKIQIRDNDWIEAYNRHGVVVCRAVVSHRVPRGMCLMYHAMDRHVNVPISEVSGTRGGTDNSLSRIRMKATHMIGGYAQFTYAFNYYGPTGSQRDGLTIIRKRQSEVVY